MIYLFGFNSVARAVAEELDTERKLEYKFVMHRKFYNAQTEFQNDRSIIIYEEARFTSKDSIVNCVGYKNLCARVEVGETLRTCGAKLMTFVSTRACISTNARIGCGIVFLGDVVVERGAHIGDHGLLWGGARICHDAKIGRGVFLAAGAIVGGFAEISDYCAVGFNSVIRDHARVPNNTKIKALSYFGHSGIRRHHD